MDIGLTHYLTVAAILFTIGVAGIILNRKNIIIILMSIELILLSVNINLVAFSTHLGDLVGQVFALIVLTLRHKPNVRRQNIAEQNARTVKTAIEIRHVRPGDGI